MGSFHVRFAIAAALLLPRLATAEPDVTVVGDLSKDGRKAAHPTPGQPAYYEPVVRGYHELGDSIAGEPPISPHVVIRLVAVELAKRGYLVIDALHPAPDIIIDIGWGLIRPGGIDVTDTSGSQGSLPSIKAREQMNRLVLGNTLAEVMPLESFNRQQFLEAAKQSRYFVVVTAYDYAAFAKQHRREPLWQTKMSVPTSGAYFNDVVVSLVSAGGPLFGNETANHPKLQALPEGHVEVGTPTEKGGGDAQPAAPAK